MKRQVDVFLNGVSLSAVSNKIIAVRVVESPAQDEATFETLSHMPGQTLIHKKRTALNLSIFMKIRELYDLSTRAGVINAINAWAAQGGELTVSYRPDTTIQVVLIQPASTNDIRSYANEIELKFVSDGSSYWKNMYSNASQLIGSAISSRFTVDGNAPTFVDAAIYFVQGGSYFEIVVDKSRMRVENVGFAGGSYVTIRHSDNGVAEILKNGESVFFALTDDSSDVLVSPGGVTPVAITTDGDVEVTFTALGRWL